MHPEASVTRKQTYAFPRGPGTMEKIPGLWSRKDDESMYFLDYLKNALRISWAA